MAVRDYVLVIVWGIFMMMLFYPPGYPTPEPWTRERTTFLATAGLIAVL